MTNVFGEEVGTRKLTFHWLFPHLTIFIDGQWSGMVSPNGWQGDIMDLHHSFGEPVMNNLHLWHSMSFNEMQLIMQAYQEHMTGDRAMLVCIGKLAERKKISLKAAEQLLKEKNVPLYTTVYKLPEE